MIVKMKGQIDILFNLFIVKYLKLLKVWDLFLFFIFYILPETIKKKYNWKK